MLSASQKKNGKKENNFSLSLKAGFGQFPWKAFLKRNTKQFNIHSNFSKAKI